MKDPLKVDPVPCSGLVHDVETAPRSNENPDARPRLSATITSQGQSVSSNHLIET